MNVFCFFGEHGLGSAPGSSNICYQHSEREIISKMMILLFKEKLIFGKKEREYKWGNKMLKRVIYCHYLVVGLFTTAIIEIDKTSIKSKKWQVRRISLRQYCTNQTDEPLWMATKGRKFLNLCSQKRLRKNERMQNRFIVEIHTSDIRMVYEYIRHMRVTYEWHANTYERHTNDIRIHTSDIQVIYEWHASPHEWHTYDMRVHTSDIRMTYKYIWMLYEWDTSTYKRNSDMRMA